MQIIQMMVIIILIKNLRDAHRIENIINQYDGVIKGTSVLRTDSNLKKVYNSVTDSSMNIIIAYGFIVGSGLLSNLNEINEKNSQYVILLLVLAIPIAIAYSYFKYTKELAIDFS